MTPTCKLINATKVTMRQPRLSSGRLGSNPESVKLVQVAIDSPPLQPCTVYFGASCGDRLRQLGYT